MNGVITVTYLGGKMRFDLQDEKRNIVGTMELDYYPGNTVHLEGLEIRSTVTFDSYYPLDQLDSGDNFDEWNW